MGRTWWPWRLLLSVLALLLLTSGIVCMARPPRATVTDVPADWTDFFEPEAFVVVEEHISRSYRLLAPSDWEVAVHPYAKVNGSFSSMWSKSYYKLGFFEVVDIHRSELRLRASTDESD